VAYVILFLLIIAVNCMPALVPPTWIVLTSFVAAFHLEVWLVVIIAVTGASIGRFILAHYIEWFSHIIFNKKQHENLHYLGDRIGKTPKSNFWFVFFYSLTPLSTTALFVAVGIAKINLKIVIPAFAIGRTISYTILLLSSTAITKNVSNLFQGVFSIKGLISTLVALITVLILIFIDWHKLLEHKKLRLNFRIWKWQEE
jgi:membrane protein YqaA with SNARE-associated domain